MNTWISALVLLNAVPATAQVTATMSRLAGGSTEIRVRNDAPAELVALAIEAKVHGAAHAPFEAYDDSAVRLAPNRETTLPVALTPLPANRETKVQVVVLCSTDRDVRTLLRQVDKKSQFSCELEQPVTAAIFADGSTAGDSSLLKRLVLRRSNLLMALDTTLDLLLDAGRRNMARQQLVEEFKKMADSLNRWYLTPEQRVGRDLYESIAGKLMNLPEVSAGMPFPPDDFVARETGALRQERAVLLQSQAIFAEAGLFAR